MSTPAEVLFRFAGLAWCPMPMQTCMFETSS
jgi:hypothetical protein